MFCDEVCRPFDDLGQLPNGNRIDANHLRMCIFVRVEVQKEGCMSILLKPLPEGLRDLLILTTMTYKNPAHSVYFIFSYSKLNQYLITKPTMIKEVSILE